MSDKFQFFSGGGDAAVPLAAVLQFKDSVIEVVDTVFVRIDSENSAVFCKTGHRRLGWVAAVPDNQHCPPIISELLYFMRGVFVK